MDEYPFIGDSPAIREGRRQLRHAAQGHRHVLLIGEIGTGKRAAARLLHQWSSRAGGPFVNVALQNLEPGFIARTLYGYVGTPFPGAQPNRSGLLAAAGGGTLFSDRIDQASDELQRHLAGVVRDGLYLRVGAQVPTALDAVVVASVGPDPEAAVAEGALRSDLYADLRACTVHLPPLRSRREDLPLLAQEYLRRHADRTKRQMAVLTDAAVLALQEHDWPGNRHELEPILIRAAALAEGAPIGPEHIGSMDSRPTRTHRRYRRLHTPGSET